MTKKEEIDQYRQDDGINQSQLKLVVINDVKSKPESDTIATYKGSLTDTLCLVPELFDEFYHLTTIDKAPPPQIQQTLEKTYQLQVDADLTPEWDDFTLLQVFREVSNVKTKDNKVLENLSQHYDYWEELVKSTGKKVITMDYYNICNQAKFTLLTHPITAEYFNNTLFADIQYQVPLYCNFEVEGVSVRLKGLLDMLVIDDHNKTVQIRDLKTTNVLPSEFKGIARKFNYAWQMSFYYHLVSILYPSYKQLPPELIIYSFAAPTKPFIKVLSKDDLFAGRNGFERLVATNIYERVEESATHDTVFHHGWETALQRYVQAKQLGLPDYDIEYYATQGKSLLNLWI